MHIFKQLTDIRTSHESRCALTSEDHGFDILAPRHVVDHDIQLVERTLVEGVHRRILDGDDRESRPPWFRKRVVVNAEITEIFEQLLLVSNALALLPLGDAALELGDRFGVAQRRDVTDILPLDKRTNHTAHVFAATGFRKLTDFDEVFWDRNLTFFLTHDIDQTTSIFGGELASCGGAYEGERRQTLLCMRRTDDDDIAYRRIRIDLLVSQDGAFDFFGTKTMPRYVDDVVGTTMQRETAVGMLYGKVTLRVSELLAPTRPISAAISIEIAAPLPRDSRSVHFETGSIAPDRPTQIRIRCGDDDLAFFTDRSRTCRDSSCRIGFAIGDPDIAHHPRQWIGVRIGT